MDILAAAKDIIYQQGFAQFSMRKLAATLSMTAANIYNYFANKDEIYLGIQTAGFAMLVERYEEVEKSGGTPEEVLMGMSQAYIKFGLTNRDYYEVMLGSNTPKYKDYVGTPLQDVAFYEKQTALSVVETATRIIARVTGWSEQAAKTAAIKNWVILHGIVSLSNNRIFPELDIDTNEIIDGLTADFLMPFKQSQRQQTINGVISDESSGS